MKAWKPLLGLVWLIPCLLGLTAWNITLRMPGESWHGSLPAPVPDLQARLRRHVSRLGDEIGERNLEHLQALRAAEDFLLAELTAMGYQVQIQTFRVGGQRCANLEAVLPGQQPGFLVLGAHYDSAIGSPGANDNGSGVAVLLELARAFAGSKPARGLRFVFFVNEEQPYFQSPSMGSLVYAHGLKVLHQAPLGMFSIETVGYYSDSPGSQHYPQPFARFYPDTGNFIGFVANHGSRPLLDQSLGAFRRHARLPSEGIATFASIDGIGWSDHWAFWQQGWQALMLTDTAPFRYPYYHSAQDTPDKLDYARMALLVEGLTPMLKDML